jgi:hypothetical protein
MFNLFGLWSFVDLIKTGGKGYRFSEGDGVAYSYSVFNSWKGICARCDSVYAMNTQGKSYNHYDKASHVVVIGILKKNASER